MVHRFILAALALSFSAPVAAQAQTVNEEELVVTGQRVEEAIRSFVEELSAPPTSEDQLARWDRRICPGVAGVRARQGQMLIDRLAQRAFEVNLDVGGPGCTPNVLIFVTPDSDVLARQLVDDYPELVGYYGDQTATTRGRAALEAFATTPRAVRWWHVAQTVTRDGQVLAESRARPNAQGGLSGLQVVRNDQAGRLARPTRQDFNRVLVIVDARRAAGLSFDALGDYVAMAALAQLDPDADVSGQPTILNLFAARDSGAEAPTSMTEWDVAYLRALYGATRNAVSAARQEGEISRRMREDVQQPEH
jgi:hypothetical protein